MTIDNKKYNRQYLGNRASDNATIATPDKTKLCINVHYSVIFLRQFIFYTHSI